MAKIKVHGVKKGPGGYNVLITLVEPGDINGEPAEITLGEAIVPVPEGMSMADIKDKITDAATGIMKAHQDAQNKRKDIEELEFPDII